LFSSFETEEKKKNIEKAQTIEKKKNAKKGRSSPFFSRKPKP
jgi:hypothetical protein